MAQTSTQTDLIMTIIDQIFASQLIPESHKVKYVEYIRDNGLTEKMLDELEKFFTQEAKDLDASIAKKEELIAGLDEKITAERARVDETQAEMLLAYHKRAKQDVKDVKNRLEKLEEEVEDIAEESQQEVEHEEEEAIRAKLGLGSE
jgi:deoxyribodipyrimidine photolyase